MKEKLTDLFYEVKYFLEEFKNKSKKYKKDSDNYGDNSDSIKVGFFIVGIFIVVVLIIFIIGSIRLNIIEKEYEKTKEVETVDFTKRDTSYLNNYDDLSESQRTILKDLEDKSVYFGDSIENKTVKVNINKDNFTYIISNLNAIYETSYSTTVKKGAYLSTAISVANLSPRSYEVDFKRTYLMDNEKVKLKADRYVSKLTNDKAFMVETQNELSFELMFESTVDNFNYLNSKLVLYLVSDKDEVKIEYDYKGG